MFKCDWEASSGAQIIHCSVSAKQSDAWNPTYIKSLQIIYKVSTGMTAATGSCSNRPHLRAARPAEGLWSWAMQRDEHSRLSPLTAYAHYGTQSGRLKVVSVH